MASFKWRLEKCLALKTVLSSLQRSFIIRAKNVEIEPLFSGRINVRGARERQDEFYAIKQSDITNYQRNASRKRNVDDNK